MNVGDLSFDWFILGLRVAFIVLIYLFLYQVARVMMKELVTLGTATSNEPAAAMPSATSSLEVLDPAESSWLAGDNVPLDHYTTIGRGAANTVRIDDSYVSGQHAEIVYDQGSWWVIDLGSTNGSFVNSRPVRGRERLTPDDIVQFGRVKLRAML